MEKILTEEEMIGARTAVMKDGSKMVLKKLKKKYFLGLVSNNSTRAINTALKKVKIPRNYFKVIMSRNIAKELKPSPVPLMKVIRTIPASKYYYVGDEDSDMKAARKAQKLLGKKIVKIGIVGWQGRERLKKSKPDFIIENLHELEKILT